MESLQMKQKRENIQRKKADKEKVFIPSYGVI